jgi:hypothetical protein
MWQGDRIAPRLERVPDAALEIVLAAARTLNIAAEQGFLSVERNFDVNITAAGRAYIEEQTRELSQGCIEASAVTADWLGSMQT